jgi:plasmid stability protein
MANMLHIRVSDEVLDRLRRRAAQEGKSPEDIASEYLHGLAEPENGRNVRRWIGSWASNVRDASLRHDDYLGKQLHPGGVQSKND